MFLTWVNVFQLNNLRWNEAARLFFARRLLSFQRLGLTSSALFFWNFSTWVFFWLFFFLLCGFGGGTRTIFANYQGINPIRLKRQKNDQTPDERFKMKNISVKQLGAFFIAAGILDGSS